MSTKDQVLTLFETHKGSYLSGEEIAAKLSLSRAAVWKAVNTLRKEGYCIDAVPNKGYCLSEETDILSVQGITKYLQPVCRDLTLELLPSLSSTNIVAREKAIAGVLEGYTVIANEQTQGKGRYGRSFFSPMNTGVYMSLVLRPPHCSSKAAARLTTMAAVAVCEAIEAVTGEKAQIKWVNDIYLHGKKICGILTEASFGLEDGFLEYAILGIGINVSVPSDGFPPALQDIAGAVFDTPHNDSKNQIAAEILNHFMSYYHTLPKTDYVEAYKKRCFVIGSKIQVLLPDSVKKATVLDIDEDCRLLVQYEDGTTETLSAGEIKIQTTYQ